MKRYIGRMMRKPKNLCKKKIHRYGNFPLLFLSNGILSVFLLVHLTARADTPPSPLPVESLSLHPIRIGVVLHLTSDVAMAANAFREGIEIALDEINKTGIAGRKVQIIVEDAKGNLRLSYSANRKLITLEKVVATLLDSHMEAVGSGPLYEKARIPAVVLWDSNEEIDSLGDYIFSLGPWTPSSGKVSADFISDRLQGKKVCIVFNREPWSEKVTEAFRASLGQRKGEILTEFPINPDEVDFRPIFLKIKQLKPDVIYTPIVYNLVSFYSQLRESGLNVPIVTSDIISDAHIKQTPQVFEGIYQSSIQEPSSPAYQSLEKSYEKKFGYKPSLKWFVATGYDAMTILGKAIQIAGTNPEQIKNELYHIQNFPGASSQISINKYGSSPQYEVMYRVQGGQMIREKE